MGLGKWDMICLNEVNKNIHNVVERSLALLRPGGVLCIHHILWNGFVFKKKSFYTFFVIISIYL